MITECSSCHGPLPAHGVYSVSTSLPPDAPRRWRVCNMTCSLACLAAVVAQMQESVTRRQRREHGPEDFASIMTTSPRSR
jgi:hypothetical protein